MARKKVSEEAFAHHVTNPKIKAEPKPRAKAPQYVRMQVSFQLPEDMATGSACRHVLESFLRSIAANPSWEIDAETVQCIPFKAGFKT